MPCPNQDVEGAESSESCLLVSQTDSDGPTVYMLFPVWTRGGGASGLPVGVHGGASLSFFFAYLHKGPQF